MYILTVFLLNLNLILAVISDENKVPICDLYFLATNMALSKENSFTTIDHVDNLCFSSPNDVMNATLALRGISDPPNRRSAFVITSYEDCSPETKALNAGLMNWTNLILISPSVIEDVLWNVRHSNFKISTFIASSGCDLSTDHEYYISADENPFILYNSIPFAVLLQIWNLLNLIYVCFKLGHFRKLKISSISLIIELLLTFCRILIFIEPLPFGILHTHLSYHLLTSINFSLSIGNMLLICYSLWEIISKTKKALLIPDTNYFKYFKEFKLPFIVMIILLMVDIVQSTFRGLYLYISIIEKIVLVYYLILVTVISIVTIITYVEILEYRRSMTRYIMSSSVGSGLIILGIILFLLVPMLPSVILFKTFVFWCGFLTISTGNILLSKMK